jgi:hypothetical protein
MGTSKGYQPPKGYLWSDSKRAVSSMVRNNFESESIGKAVGRYNQAVRQGGAYRRQQDLSVAGSKAVGFFSMAKMQGLEKALEHVGLNDLIGKSNVEIYMGLLDYFAGSSSTLDDSIVRDSMAELLKELFLDVSDEKSFEDIISDLDMNKFIKDLITKFIQKDFFVNFSEKIEAKCKNIDEYKDAEKKIKDYIKVKIDTRYSTDDLSKIDWHGQQGKTFINDRCNEVIKVFDIYLEG